MASESAPGRILTEDIIGTRYPYINLIDSGLGTKLTDFRRSISSINPFALPQIPSQDRIAFGLRRGNGWYNPLPYPNGIMWWKMFPGHYDPLNDEPKKERWQAELYSPAGHSHFIFTADKLPRGCVRTIQAFKRCEMVNGQGNCANASQEILSVCPAWALDELKEKQRFLAKVSAINRLTYQSAMEVSDYNKGRTVADVSDRTWIDGTREHLRPDTMWADERYSKITQAEINEAKKRIEEKQRARTSKLAQHEHKETTHEHAGEHHYDYKHVSVKHAKPLYP
jgi:hypothetical protein